MSATTQWAGPAPATGLLDRRRTIARPGFNRWLVPPAALAIHLCIGMAYGMSVFWLPLAHTGAVCQGEDLAQSLVSGSCAWSVSELVVGFELAIVFLGGAAALWGGWLERVGPRCAGVVASLCWCLGLGVAAAGIAAHQLWLFWLGFGGLGGIGLGLGYISPVSTLLKWFPDRRGMATGMAIMGFGGGAMIGAPLATRLMAHYRSAAGPGVWQTFLTLAVIYLAFMLAGSFAYRVPPANWQPDDLAGRAGPPATRRVAAGHVHLNRAWKTPQFWLIWLVLMLNVTAGIGVLSMASPMLQQLFTEPPAVAAGFVGLLSLFNIAGRFVWASASDRLGRKLTFAIFFLLGIALYAAAPWAAHGGSKFLFVAMFCIIISMYGGGFATVPAYLADVFGTQFVGAIHGRLLTAWSTAGVLGPLLVSYISQQASASGVPAQFVYDTTLHVLTVLLGIGFIANLLVRPLQSHWFMSAAELAAVQGRPQEAGLATGSFGIDRGGLSAKVVLAWLCVLLPIAWGVWMTVSQTLVMF